MFIYMKNWYFGTSGLVLPVPNKSHYPDEFKDGSRLHYYASLFSSIEVNSTFYKLPRADTVIKWAAEVPSSFKFTFKVPSAVSHEPDLRFDKKILLQFLDIVEGAGAKRGCLLLQVPAKMQANTLRLKQILTLISKYNWPVAFESRNTSWFQPPVQKLLQKFEVTTVIHDWHSFKIPMETSSQTVYLRFHGPEKNYRGSYNADHLHNTAQQIRKWLKEKTVYTYFNNTLGNVSGNLNTLIDEVKLKGPRQTQPFPIK